MKTQNMLRTPNGLPLGVVICNDGEIFLAVKQAGKDKVDTVPLAWLIARLKEIQTALGECA